MSSTDTSYGPVPKTAFPNNAFQSVCELLHTTRSHLRRLSIEAQKHEEILAQERLDHRACQEALQFERDRREESDNLVGRLFNLSGEAGEVADSLRIQLMQARGIRRPSPFDC